MSRGSNQCRNRRSQSAKPYNVANSSIVKRWAQRVSSYIPQSLGISSWFNDLDGQDEEEEEVQSNTSPPTPGPSSSFNAAVRQEVSSSQQPPAPPQPPWPQLPEAMSLQQQTPRTLSPPKPSRTVEHSASTSAEGQLHLLNNNNFSMSAIQNSIGPSGGFVRPGNFGQGAMPMQPPFVSSTPLLGPPLTRSLMIEPQPGPSGLQGLAGPSGVAIRQNAYPVGTPATSRQQLNAVGASAAGAREHTEVNGDDGTDSSESTSGCSSLIPQGIPSEREQLQQQPVPRKEGALKRAHNASRSSSNMHLQRSIFAKSGGVVPPVPQAAAPNRRPAFDSSLVSPPTALTTSLTAVELSSPFYPGKTCYGGASAQRRMSRSPNAANSSLDSYLDILPKSRTGGSNSSLSEASGPRIIRATTANPSLNSSRCESEVVMSCASKRILDSIMSVSSPVSMCSRIPFDDLSPEHTPSKRARISNDPYGYQGPRATPGRPGPPSAALPVPTMHELLRMRRLREFKLQDSTEAARKLTDPKVKPAWDDSRIAYSLRQDDTDGERHTNKMRRKQQHQEEDDDMPIPVNLPSIPLPLTTLPTFDLGPMPFASSAPKHTPSSTSKVDLGNSFTFSTPIVVKESPSKNNFKSYVPFKKPDTSLASGDLGSGSKQSASFHIPKDMSSLVKTSSGQGVCSKEVKAKTDSSSSHASPKVTNSLGDMFKPPPGSWSCSVCDVRNKVDAKACVACSSSRPGTSQQENRPASLKPSVPELPAAIPQQQGFGAQFSSSGKWECSECMLLNANSLDKCPSCTAPKPGSSQKQQVPSITLTQPSTGFGSQFTKTGKWECSVCMLLNDDVHDKCPSCTAAKPGSGSTKTNTTSSFQGFGAQFSKGSKWECSCCMLMNEQSSDACPSCTTPKPGSQPKPPTVPSPASAMMPLGSAGFGDKFKKPAGSWECGVCLVVNKDDASKCISCETTKPGTNPAPAMLPKSTFKFGVADSKEAPTFKFGVEPESKPKSSGDAPKPSLFASDGPTTFSFGIPASAPETTTTSTAAKATFTFGVPKTEESIVKPLDSKPTFPIKSPVAAPAKIETSSSVLKTTEPKSFQFGIPAMKTELSPKTSPTQASKRRYNEEEPIAKKSSFEFTTPTSSTDVPKTSAPTMMFGLPPNVSTAMTTNKLDSSSTSNFVFTPANSSPKLKAAAPAPVPTTTLPEIFSFGASSKTTTAGTGFASKAITDGAGFGSTTFGAKTTETTKSMFAFGGAASTNPASDQPKPFAFGGTSSPSTFGSAGSTATPTFGSLSSGTPTIGASSQNPSAAIIATPVFGSGTVSGAASAQVFGANISAGATTTTTTTPSSFGSQSAAIATSTLTFGAPALTNSAIPSFGQPATTTTTALSPFSSTAAASSLPTFGAAGKSTLPAFSSTTKAPMFSSTNSSSSTFRASPTATPTLFGSASSAPAPLFGDAPKAVTFADTTPKTTSTALAAPSPSLFTFGGSKPQKSTSDSLQTAPPPYPAFGGPVQSSTGQGALGGFSFGSNTGAPSNQATSGFAFSGQKITGGEPSKSFGFVANAPSFSAPKALESTPSSSVFSAGSAPNIFGATSTPPAPTFGSVVPAQQPVVAPKFGEPSTAFPSTTNFAFGSTATAPATFGFGQASATSSQSTTGSIGGFSFGHQSQPSGGTAAPPHFDPNARPTFNFTGGTGITAFSASPSASPQPASTNQMAQRRIRKAARRMQPPNR